MATTTNQQIPYATPADAPDVPYWQQRLAERVDALLTALFATPPGGHMGMTGGFQPLTAGGTKCIMAQAQKLKGGMTFDDAADALVIPKDGTYLVQPAGYFSGAGVNGNSAIAMLVRGTAAAVELGSPAIGDKTSSSDIRITAGALVDLKAGDKVYLQQKSSVSAWGTTGYNGSALTITWHSA